MNQSRWAFLSVAAVVCLLVAGAAPAQTKSMEFRNGEVLAVDGNVVTVRGPDGVKQFIVPESFKFDLDGKQLTVHDLKPGMKSSAMVTTIETPLDVMTTEVKQGEVVYNAGGTLVVRDLATKEMKQFTPQDLKTRNVVLVMDGKEMDPMKLRKGDKFSATIVTKYPPKIVTDQDIKVFMAAAPPPPPPPAEAKIPPPPPPPPPAKPVAAELPKTGSLLPLIGFSGVALAGLGVGVALLRKLVTPS